MSKPQNQSRSRGLFSHSLPRRLIDTICATSYFRFFQFFFLFFLSAARQRFSFPRRHVIDKGIRAILRINERRAAVLHYPL